MAKKIIVLEKLVEDDTGTAPKKWKLAFWLDVPLARQPFYANPNAKSAYLQIDTTPGGELDQLKSGAVVEKTEVISRREGSTQADMMADAEELWQRFQNEVTNVNKWSRYGSFWDGTTWTLGGVS